MNPQPIPKQETLAALPPVWPFSLLNDIRTQFLRSGQRLVILDDDPTGTQTVHDVPLITEWSVGSLKRELLQSPVFFILTNSRSLPEAVAVRQSREIGHRLQEAASQAGVTFEVLSRSDSTLRGHFPAEVDALCEAVGQSYNACILAPYFGAGGRYTLNQIHYVAQGDRLIPANMTEYAKDKAFPFHHAFLPDYVEEKSRGKIAASQVYNLNIKLLRRRGPDAVCERLLEIPRESIITIDACAERDLEVAVSGMYQAKATGKNYIYRTAASFVRVLAGIPQRPLLQAHELRHETPYGGLMIVGSHIAKSSAQLKQVLALSSVTGIELEVNQLLDPKSQEICIQNCLKQISDCLQHGRNAVLYTSRKLIAGNSAQTSLKIGSIISRSLCEIVQQLSLQPRFLIAKGGITSNDIATHGLNVKRALVAGQLQPGVPVWRLEAESKFPGMYYVVYPGNVGTETGLAEAVQALEIVK